LTLLIYLTRISQLHSLYTTNEKVVVNCELERMWMEAT